MPFNIPQGTPHFGIPVAPLEVAPTFPAQASREGGSCMQVPTIKRQKFDEHNGDVSASISKTPTTRQKVSGMNSEERLQWSRQQSAQHSKKTRDRHKAMEKDLRAEIEQLKSFRTLVEASHQLVSIHSVCAEGTFLYANSVFFRALNYVPQDLIGQPLLNLCHPQDRPVLSAALMRATTGQGNPCVTVDWRMHSVKAPGPPRAEPHFVSVSSSMSVNRQGLVLFSMLRDGQELVTSFASNGWSALSDLSCAAAAMPEAATATATAPPFYSRVVSTDSSCNSSYDNGSFELSSRDDTTAEV